jgi:3-isopropylmalate/(R)-2-methylmalate dehydratase small subunit
MNTLVKRGKCHVFGNNIPLDEGFIPFEMAIARITDPAKLIPHLFKTLDPGFSERVRPGDVVIAGSEFGCGKPHVQGFIALQALDVSVVCMSMPYKNLRRAVAKGVLVLDGAPAPSALATSGDEVEVDFGTGRFRNLSRGTLTELPAMSPILLDIVNNGGMNGVLRAWLNQHPEQAAGAADLALLEAVQSVPVSFVKKEV